jgi:hypothetical protein
MPGMRRIGGSLKLTSFFSFNEEGGGMEDGVGREIFSSIGKVGGGALISEIGFGKGGGGGVDFGVRDGGSAGFNGGDGGVSIFCGAGFGGVMTVGAVKVFTSPLFADSKSICMVRMKNLPRFNNGVAITLYL